MDNTSKSYKHSKHKNINKKNFPFTAMILVACMMILGSFLINMDKFSTEDMSDESLDIGAFEIIEPTLKYGFVLDTFQVIQSEIKANQFLSDLLLQYKVDYVDIDKLVENTKDVFDVRNIRVGNPYMILNADPATAPDYFIYEPSVYNYLVYDLRNHTVKKVEKEVITETETASGIIESSLWQTMIENDLSVELTSKMEDALAWSIDFHHIHKDDRFKLIYERHYIDGKSVGVGKIKGAYFKNGENEFYAFYFENEVHSGFYDLEARPMEKAFLKSPVKYSRISSHYNTKRFHPILRRTKAHLGTDYAAPHGTPIVAVADGVVKEATRSGGNGNYVKIKHDGVYQTQYLHMSKFATGIKPGTYVKQGETIGYVGSTGLATGPHVCFRFWKNGKQINHLKENLPPPEPMASKDIPRFNILKDALKKQLDLLEFNGIKSEISERQIIGQDSTFSSTP